MATAKMAAMDRAKLTKAFKESVEGRNYTEVALAMFRHVLTTGLRDEWSRRQTQWAPLAPRYMGWKRKRGLSQKIWEATGATLRAITNNPPERAGTKRKLQFGINFIRDLAFARPRAFKKAKSGRAWRELGNADFQGKVLNVLRYGNAKEKLTRYAKKKGGKAEDYRKFSKHEGRLPGRPLIVWPAASIKRIEEDVAAAVSKIFNR